MAKKRDMLNASYSTMSNEGAQWKWHSAPATSTSCCQENTNSRFDWRQRATSRVKHKYDSERDGLATPRVRKRVLPPPNTTFPGAPFYDAIQTYSNRFLALIESERESEEQAVKQRLSSWPLDRLRRSGYALTGMSAFWLERKPSHFGKPAASFSIGPGMRIPENKFENGSQVLVSRLDPLKEQPITGNVLFSTDEHIHVSFENEFQIDGNWRLDLGRSDTIYNRLVNAIHGMDHDPAEYEFPDSSSSSASASSESPTSYLSKRKYMSASSSPPETILRGTYLRDILLASFDPESPMPDYHPPLQDPDDLEYVKHDIIEHEIRISPRHYSTATTDVCSHGKFPTSQKRHISHESGEMSSSPVAFKDGAFSANAFIRSWAVRMQRSDPIHIEGDPVLEGLNDTQRRAVALMVGNRISLVQGPPGTGKTKTIISTIHLLKAHFQVPEPLLVCTYTNVAVDNLVEGLVRKGLKPLRVGSTPSATSSSSSSVSRKTAAASAHDGTNLTTWTLDHQFEQHPLRPRLEKLYEDAREVERKLSELNHKITQLKTKYDLALPSAPTKTLFSNGLSSSSDMPSDQPGDKADSSQSAATKQKSLKGNMAKRAENMMMDTLSLEKQLNALQGKAWVMRQTILREIVAEADVICTTCVTSASRALDVVDFPVVFLDEASMSTEPASLIPLMKGSRHVSLIGDHKQLPPVIISRHAQEMGLGVSLFERLTEEGVVPSIMLDIQYRMHPSISLFPSSEFYNFALRDGTNGVDSLARLAPPLSRHLISSVKIHPAEADASAVPSADVETTVHRPSVVFLDHAGSESMKERSRVNHDEANIVCTVIEDLLLKNETLTGRDIGIIAPYVAQISLFKRLLHGTSATYLPHFKKSLGDLRAMQLGEIEIKTVDGFEGREKDVIIFSTVRNRPAGTIASSSSSNNGSSGLGFLEDRRRLNVGLTRAKRALFVVGSMETIRGSAATGATVKEDSSSELTTTIGSPPTKKRKSKGAGTWERYAKYLDEKGLVLRIDLPVRFGVAPQAQTRRTHVQLYMLPQRNEAIARVRNGSIGLSVLLVASLLSPALPSLPVATYAVLVWFSDRRRTISWDEDGGFGYGIWMCVLELGIASVLLLNIIQGGIALKFPPKPIPTPKHASTPNKPKPAPRSTPKSPSASGLTGLAATISPQRQKTYSPYALTSSLSRSSALYDSASSSRLFSSTGNLFNTPSGIVTPSASAAQTQQDNAVTPSKPGPGGATAGIQSVTSPSKSSSSPLLSLSLMNASLSRDSSPVVSAYKGKHAIGGVGRALDGSFLSRLTRADSDED